MYSGFFQALSGVFSQRGDLSNSPTSEESNLFYIFIYLLVLQDARIAIFIFEETKAE